MSLLSELSLRQKLPLLVVVLTTGALVVGGAVMYAEVSRASRMAAELRLESASTELSTAIERSLRTRWDLEDRVASSPAVRAALAGRWLDTASLVTMLDSLRGTEDGRLPVSIVKADGTLAFHDGSMPDIPDDEAAPAFGAERAVGPFRRLGDRAVYWTSLPIRGAGDQPIGWIAQRRRVGSPSSGGLVGSLIGSGVRVLLGNQSDSVWIDLGGEFVHAPPSDVHMMSQGFFYGRDDGVEMLAVATPLEDSPWIVHVEIPRSEVLARPRTFLSAIAALGFVLVSLVLVISLRAGRRLTVPLEELAGAADAVAQGDYRSRVVGEGHDEVGRLARAFNAMAEQVERADEALRQRLDEAKALTMRLEEANAAGELAREEALSASKAKSDFLATMSHEIRTPINAVIGYTELLKVGIPDQPSPAQRDYIERIQRSSRLLISLVNDVLDLSRIESGTLRVDVGTGSTEEAILAAVAVLEPEAATKSIALTTECVSDDRFRGDEQRVQQILLNLLSNAVKFTPKGGSVTVTCSHAATGPDGVDDHTDWLRIDVEDTGIGIDAQQIERVFEPFAQGETGYTREHGGAGLGLAISRRLATLMQGDLTLESEPGVGSRFTLWLRSAGAEEAALTA